jgi:putative ABC transport system ATP-binding protein
VSVVPVMVDSNSVINLQRVCRSYQVGKIKQQVLGPVTLQVQPGESLAIVGPSGSGKSTLLSIIGCLEHPSAGLYYLNGVDATALEEHQRARVRRDYIGFVFQRFHLIAELTVAKNVALPLAYQRRAHKETTACVTEVLERVGLSGKEKMLPSQLSGGEQQRVAVARAIVSQPKVILADEPTGNLDSKTGIEVMRLLLEIHQQDQRRVLIVVTHNMDVACMLDNIVTLRDGQLISKAPGQKGELVP